MSCTYLQPTGATVYLNETDIVVSEGDDSSTGSTTIDICVVLAGAMGGLQRNIVIDFTVVSDNANSKSSGYLSMYVLVAMWLLCNAIHYILDKALYTVSCEHSTSALFA